MNNVRFFYAYKNYYVINYIERVIFFKEYFLLIKIKYLILLEKKHKY